MSAADLQAPGADSAGGLAPALVRVDGVVKTFGSVRAVRGVTLEIRSGEVTAIVGENGAGKSTLVKMLAGVEFPDAGTLTVDGELRNFRSARDAALAGIGMVFQETALVPDLAVWENIVLGWEQTTGPLLDKAGTLTALDELSREYGLPVPHRRRVGTLAMSVQQQVEILKVLYREARVVILDEPTGILTPQETRGLFLAIDKLKKAGKSVVFISHKLNEVLEIADTIHVMRAGELITTVAPGELAPRDLARLMLGSEPPSVERRVAHGEREAVFVATDLVVENPQSGATVGPSNLTVRQGSVLGIAGVAGSGQDEFVAAITGLDPVVEGSFAFHGTTDFVVEAGGSSYRTVRALREAGMAYIPSDRNNVATDSAKPLWFSAAARRQWLPQFVRRGIFNERRARRTAADIIENARVRASGVDARPGSLSGGNLQKFIVGREMTPAPVLLVAEDPTRGIDVGSAIGIRQQIRDLVDAGGAAIVVSSDLDELLEICDEIAVFFNGRIVMTLPRDEATLESLGEAMTGLVRQGAGE